MTQSNAQLFIQIYTDEHIAASLIKMLRRHGYVVQSAIEIGMIERDDNDHLAYATHHNMALLTFNGSDFDRIAREWTVAECEHAGIIISPQFGEERISELFHALIRLLNAMTADEIRNQVIYLQQFGAHRPKHLRETPIDYSTSLTPV